MADRYAELPTGNSNWSSVNTWKATTGGATGASVPISTDNVYVNADSCDAGATLTVDATASCLDFLWTGATNTPTLAHSATLDIYGSYIGIAGMVKSGSSITTFIPTSSRQTITSGTSWTSPIRFGTTTAPGSSWILLDAFTSSSSIQQSRYTFDTNGQTVTVANFYIDGASTKILTLGSSVVNTAAWDYSGSALTLTANTATINVSGTGAGAFGDANYNGATFNFNGTAHTLSGSPTGIAGLNFKPAGAQTITATGATLSVGSMTRTGTGLITIVNGTFVKIGGGIIKLYNASISGSTATPRNTWFATGNSVNGGSNSGWNFAKSVGIALINTLKQFGVI